MHRKGEPAQAAWEGNQILRDFLKRFWIVAVDGWNFDHSEFTFVTVAG